METYWDMLQDPNERSHKRTMQEGRNHSLKSNEEHPYLAENEGGDEYFFSDNSSISSWSEEDKVSLPESESYIFVEKYSRLKYISILYTRIVSKVNNNKFLYFIVSLALSCILYFFRLILMRTFRLLNLFENPEFVYGASMLRILPIDAILSMLSLAAIFYFYKVRILQFVIYLAIILGHIAYILVCIKEIDIKNRVLGFSKMWYILSAILSSLVVTFVLNFCFRINRVNKEQMVYITMLFFVSYLFIMVCQTEDLFRAATDTSPINLISIHNVSDNILTNKLAMLRTNHQIFQDLDEDYRKALFSKIDEYLEKSASLKITSLFLLVIFYHLYRLILEVKSSQTEDIQEDERNHDEEMNLIKNAGIYIYIQLIIIFGWSLSCSISIMYIRYFVAEAYQKPTIFDLLLM